MCDCSGAVVPGGAARRFRSRNALSVAICALACLGLTLPAQAETLEEALSAAYTNNPQILAERANLRAIDEGVNQALAGWRPTLQMTGSAGRARFENTPVATNQTMAQGMTTPRSVDFQLTQPIYQGGQTVAKTAEAEDQVKSERATLIATEAAVFLNVVQAYLDIVRDEAVVALDRNSEHVLATVVESTRDQFHVGSVTRTDVAQAEARLAAASAQRQVDEGTLNDDRATYARYVGHAPINLHQPQLRPTIPAKRGEALSLAATNNPTVISAQFSEDASRAAIAATEAQLLPSVNLVGDAGRSDDANFVAAHETTSESVQLQLTMPLYEGGTIYSQSRQAKQKLGQSEHQTDDARHAAVQNATQAWENIQAERANIASQHTAINAAQIAFEGLQFQQKAGTRTVIDVLNAEQELFADRVNLVRAEHDLLLAEFNLADQIGRLTAADLKLPVNLYDVQRYYQAVRGKWIGLSARP